MYVVADVVAGLSKKINEFAAVAASAVALPPVLPLVRLPAVSPIKIAVLPCINRQYGSTPAAALPTVKFAKTKTLLDALDGVTLTEKPVTST